MTTPSWPRVGAPISAAVLLTFAIACAGSGDTTTSTASSTSTTSNTPTTPTTTTAAVASVSLSPSACTLNPSGTCVLTATLKDASNNTLTGRSITWTSSATNVATVSTSGTVTAVAAGSAVITATSESKSATANITVSSTSASTVVVQVDASSSAGTIADLFGVNRRPRETSRTGTIWDGTALYTAFNVSQVRAHGTSLDVCVTYTAATKLDVSSSPSRSVAGCTVTPSGGPPHFKWTPTSSADSALNNPANYDFAGVDSAVAAINQTGARLYLRLGEGTNGPNDTDDPVAFAKVATNIYKHVIGQFKPSSVTADPAYVEVWNEPDGVFWQGAASTFDSLYVQTVSRVRTAAAAAGKSVIIGGTGFTTNVLAKSAITSNVAYQFGNTVGASNIDFYSAHHYGSCSTATLSAAATFFRNVRALADGQGLSGKPMHITEWNIGLGEQCGDAQYADQRLQSYTSAVLTLMQDPAQRITAAHMYAGMGIMALFDFSTTAGKVRVNPGAWAFWAHTRLKGATALTAQVCPGGTGCVNGYAAETKPLLALAGSSGGTRMVVVTNDGSAAVTYTLRFTGLSASTVTATISTPPAGTQELTLSGSPQKADASAITALLALPTAEVRSALGVTGGQLEITLTLAAHSLQVIELR